MSVRSDDATTAGPRPASARQSLRPGLPVVLAGLVGGAAVVAGVSLTATSGWLIVRAAEGPQILLLLTAIVAVRAFGIARPALRYAERLRSHDAALADLSDRRSRLYAALVPLTPARLGRRARAEALGGMVDDLTDVVDAQVRVAVPVISALVSGGLAAVLTAVLSPAAGLVLASLLAAAAAACVVADRLEAAAQDEVLTARAGVLRVADLVTRQANELAAVGGSESAERWLSTAHVVLRRALLRQSRGRALVAALLLLSTVAATIASAVIAARSGLGGPLAALLVVVPVAVGDSLSGLADVVRALARARAARDRLERVTGQAPAVADPSGSTPGTTAGGGGRAARTPRHTPPVLRLTDVSAQWEPGTTALPPTTLTLLPGSRTAVVGANGSGKSTLLAVIARQLDPATGCYDVDGHDTATAGLRAVRELFAIVDDEPHVFATTVRENLRVAVPDATDEDVRDALDRARLGAWCAALPDGLDTRLGTGGLGVSGGERARLALARALLADRPVLLLDEPVAHLDHATALEVLADVLDASRGRTVVMVSHRPDGLAGFDRILDLTPPEPCRPTRSPRDTEYRAASG